MYSNPSLIISRGSPHGSRAKNDKTVLDAISAFGPKNMLSAWPRPGVREADKRAFIVAAGEAIGNAIVSDKAVEALRIKALQPPVAQAQPKVLTQHGDERIDPFYWLRDDARTDKKVLSYLREENEYRKSVMADTTVLQEDLYKELRGHIQEADEAVPVRHGPYHYYWRIEEGANYKIHCRRAIGASVHDENEVMDLSQPEEILLDENQRHADGKKAGREFYSLGSLEVSPDHKLMAWSEDTVGRERFTIRIKDLVTGKELISPVNDTSGEIEWYNDNSTFLFVTKDDLDRPYKVWRSNLSAPAPSLVFEEADESFYVGIGKSRSEQILFISSGSAITSEEQICHADKPDGDFKVLIPRKHDVQYDAMHSGEGEVFVLNLRDKGRPNGEILLLNGSGSEPSVLLPHSSQVKIEGVSMSSAWLVVWQRKLGLQCATIFKRGSTWSLADGQDLSFDDEPAYSIWAGSQADFSSPILRLVYTSLTTPSSTIDFNLETGSRAVKKVQPVPHFDKSLYATERIWCTSHDDVKVPISLVYRKDKFKKDGSSRLLLDGYGSYEISNDPYFTSSRLPLLDRGFVYAIAHIRGGGEMGRLWYEVRLTPSHLFMFHLTLYSCFYNRPASSKTSPTHSVTSSLPLSSSSRMATLLLSIWPSREDQQVVSSLALSATSAPTCSRALSQASLLSTASRRCSTRPSL